MIFTEANKTERTCDGGPGVAASCVYIKCLYLEMRTHDSAVKLLYWKHSKEKKNMNFPLMRACGLFETLGHFMRN